MADQITVIRIGVPGASGANVSAAEKASYVTLTAANVFTNAQEVRSSSATALTVSSGAATTDRTLVVDSASKEVEIWNGGDVRVFSDAGVTQVFLIDGATGDVTITGDLTVTGAEVKGEKLWLSFRAYEGGTVLTTGVKDFAFVPYNCTIESDGTRAWTATTDPAGSISWDLWYSGTWPPTSANRISGTVGTQNPRTTAAASASSATLTGWTTVLAKGGYIFASIAGTPATATRSAVGIHVRKT